MPREMFSAVSISRVGLDFAGALRVPPSAAKILTHVDVAHAPLALENATLKFCGADALVRGRPLGRPSCFDENSACRARAPDAGRGSRPISAFRERLYKSLFDGPLLLTQRRHRVETGRPQRGDAAGNQSDRGEQRHGESDGYRIPGLQSI